jgi:hypothetical protein
MKSKFSVIIILFILLISPCESVILEAKKHPSFEEALSPSMDLTVGEINPTYSDSGSGSHTPDRSNSNKVQSEQNQIIVQKKLFSPNKDVYYINETIGISVKVTNKGRNSIDKAEIWDYIEPGLELIGFSHPVRTSSIGDAIDYEKNGFYFSTNNDIKNPIRLARMLQNPKDNLSLYINSNFSKDSRDILINASNSNPDVKLLNAVLVNELNTILEDRNLFNHNRFCSIKLSEETHDMLKILRIDEDASDTVQLCNRMLLEDAYPDEFKRISVKPLETLTIDKEIGSIYTPVKQIYPRESIIYKYWFKPVKAGIYNTDTIIRLHSNPIYPDDVIPLKIEIIEEQPEFQVNLDMEELELECGETIDLTYIIKYLGGSSINPCTYNVTLSKSNKYELSNTSFPEEILDTQKNSLINSTICYLEEGTYSLPTISIAGQYYNFEEKVKVIKWWRKYIIDSGLFFVTILLVYATLTPEILRSQKSRNRKIGIIVLLILILIITILFLH